MKRALASIVAFIASSADGLLYPLFEDHAVLDAGGGGGMWATQ